MKIRINHGALSMSSSGGATTGEIITSDESGVGVKVVSLDPNQNGKKLWIPMHNIRSIVYLEDE